MNMSKSSAFWKVVIERGRRSASRNAARIPARSRLAMKPFVTKTKPSPVKVLATAGRRQTLAAKEP